MIQRMKPQLDDLVYRSRMVQVMCVTKSHHLVDEREDHQSHQEGSLIVKRLSYSVVGLTEADPS